MKLRLRELLLLFGVLVGFVWQPQLGFGQSNGVIISRVGLSQAHGTTFLTMILSRADQPKIHPVTDRQSPQLLIDFPKAKVFDVPANQPGDQQLVKQVRTVALPGGDGVRIILDLFPGRPYTYWRSSKAGTSGGNQYMIGIKPDPQGGEGSSPGLVADKRSSAPAQESAPASPPTRNYPSEREPATPPAASEDRASAESSRTSTDTSDYRRPTSGPMSEIAQLMPAAGPALGFLEQKGWSVQKNTTGRAGSPGTKKFLLSNSQYPNLSINIEHIPTHAAGSPGINLIALSTDKIADSDADKYRHMVHWDMAAIKKHYEDIGDYYDDGLKPLRLRLREQSKAIGTEKF